MTTHVTAAPVSAGADRSLAVREIGVFLATTAALLVASTSIALAEDVDVSRIEDASALGQAAMYTQALFPLVGAVVARLATAGSLRRPGWGFRRAPWRVLALAWAVGVATILTGAALVWATGTGAFDTGSFGPQVVLGLTVLVLPYVVLALGEDVGWRGLLVTRMSTFCSPRTLVVGSGLVWAAFHWPLIAFLGGTPDGVPVWYALVVFTVGITALGAVLASMQLRWGIWPGVVTHAVWNATLYHVVDTLTSEQRHFGWFGTETGLCATVAAVACAALWLRRFPIRTEGAQGADPDPTHAPDRQES